MAKAARKARGGGEGEAVKPSETTRITSQKKVRELLKLGRETRTELNEISSQYGTAVKGAVDNHFLHRKAFAMTRALDKMEPEALADTMAHFEHYYEVSGLRERAETVQRLDLPEGQGEADEEGEGEGGKRGRKGNVAAFPNPNGAQAD